jgi:Family of unknown function (DUF5723)
MQFSFKAFQFILVSLLSTTLVGQEQLGLRLDNYSGVSGISLNPTSNATAQLGWDINLAGAGLFFNNNVAFIGGASVGKAASNADKIGAAEGLDIKMLSGSMLKFDFYDNLSPKYFSLSTQIMGPSFVVNLKSGHSFGLFTGARFMVGSQDLPSITNAYEFQKKKYGEVFDVDPFKVTGMGWREVGVNYAYRMGDDTEGALAFGANVRYVTAYQSFYFKNFGGTKMARLSKDSVTFQSFRGEAGFNSNAISQKDLTTPNGSGIGFDIGATLTIPSDDSDLPYKWRLGASILDMGAVTFDNNSEVHRVDIKEPYQANKSRFENLDPADPGRDAWNRFSQDVSGSPSGTLRSNSFSMGMPAAISVQADYTVMKGVFVNGLLMQRLPVGEQVLYRDNLFAITPRYESRWLGASLPISVVNWSTTRVGLAARLAFLTLGTDDLGSLITNGNLTGTDFYIALKINPFKTGLVGGGSGSSRRGREQACYRF